MKHLLYIFIFVPALLFSYDIAIIGDSISAGYKVKKNVCYAGILASKIKGITINNAAVNSGSTKETEKFILKVFSNDSPKILILALGTADAGYYQIAPNLIYQNFEKIIQLAMSRSTIVFLGRVELGDRFDHLSKDYKSQFHNIYTEIEKNYPGVIQFEFMSDSLFLNPHYTLDGTHPNANGHKVIAEILEPLIRQFIY